MLLFRDFSREIPEAYWTRLGQGSFIFLLLNFKNTVFIRSLKQKSQFKLFHNVKNISLLSEATRCTVYSLKLLNYCFNINWTLKKKDNMKHQFNTWTLFSFITNSFQSKLKSLLTLSCENGSKLNWLSASPGEPGLWSFWLSWK